jgi:hypothetical protein
VLLGIQRGQALTWPRPWARQTVDRNGTEAIACPDGCGAARAIGRRLSEGTAPETRVDPITVTAAFYATSPPSAIVSGLIAATKLVLLTNDSMWTIVPDNERQTHVVRFPDEGGHEEAKAASHSAAPILEHELGEMAEDKSGKGPTMRAVTAFEESRRRRTCPHSRMFS